MGKRVYTLQFVPRKQRRAKPVVYATAGAALFALLGWIFWRNTVAIDTPETVPAPAATPQRPPVTRPSPAKATTPPAIQPATPAIAPAVPVISPNTPAARGASRPVRDAFEAQIALDRMGISSGSIDGLIGSQTRAALVVFQNLSNLPETGQLDAATRQALRITEPSTTSYLLQPEDIARLRPLGATWLAKSQQDGLDYESLLELLAEKFHAHPKLLQRLNPALDWSTLAAGAKVVVPRVEEPPLARAARVRVHLASRTMQVYDARGALLAHFPCSIAQRVDKRPVGELHVAVLAPNPNYTFDPAVFPESPEARQLGRKLILAPGPNNPVGAAWIGLDRAGYGIHGTPNPEQVGRTESHGCFRLANWNAERLLRLAWVGLPVVVEP